MFMHIIIRCNDLQKEELLTKPVNDNVSIDWYGEDDLIEEADADVYFDLLFDKEHTGANLFVKGRPVFANAVISTTADIKYENYIRINAWPGFLDKPLLEIAATDSMELIAEEIMNKIGWTYTFAPDEPGMIAARVIAMVINEAYYGLADEISSKEDIDTAMKLGTNYPYGPFEWAQKIGLSNIYYLLKKLEQQNPRYAPSPLIAKELGLI